MFATLSPSTMHTYIVLSALFCPSILLQCLPRFLWVLILPVKDQGRLTFLCTTGTLLEVPGNKSTTTEFPSPWLRVAGALDAKGFECGMDMKIGNVVILESEMLLGVLSCVPGQDVINNDLMRNTWFLRHVFSQSKRAGHRRRFYRRPVHWRVIQ